MNDLADDDYAFWQERTREIYKLYSDETSPTEVTVLGKNFVVLPQVFSPAFHANSEFFASSLPSIISNSSLLEIGTGTGVIAICCALEGARVVAIDSNPTAVENCKINSKKHGVIIDTREAGSLFEPIAPHEKFDYIFWNHPWNYCEEKPESLLLQAGFDYKYEAVFSFLREAPRYLHDNGSVLLGTGSFARLREIEEYAKMLGYTWKIVESRKSPLSTQGGESIEFYIYEFKVGA